MPRNVVLKRCVVVTARLALDQADQVQLAAMLCECQIALDLLIFIEAIPLYQFG